MNANSMKVRIWTIVVALTLVHFSAVAQPVVTVFPTYPCVGDSVTIWYNPKAPGALFKDRIQIRLVLAPYGRLSVGRVFTLGQSYDMVQEEGLWKMTVVLDNPETPYIGLQFVADLTGSRDDNNGEGFGILLNGRDGKALKDAHLLKYLTLQHVQGKHAEIVRDDALAKERTLYPQNYRVWYIVWNNEWKARSSDRMFVESVRMTLDSLRKAQPEDLDALVACANGYRLIGDSLRAQTAELALADLFPTSFDSQVLAFRRASSDPNPRSRADSLRQLLGRCPHFLMAYRIVNNLRDYYLAAGDTTTFVSVEREWKSELERSQPRTIVSVIDRSKRPISPSLSNLRDLRGRLIPESQPNGKVNVIEFWAIGCAPCREAFPYF